MSLDSQSSVTRVTLRLPDGRQYHLDVASDDLAGWLAPGRRAPLEQGTPIDVEVTCARGRYVIPVGSGELAHLLSQASLAADHAPRYREQPRPISDPWRGRGLYDPKAHRLGPNADRAPDPGHRGLKRRRTP